MTKKIRQYTLYHDDDGQNVLMEKWKYDYSPVEKAYVNTAELIDRLHDITEDKEQAQVKALKLIFELTEAIPGSD